jgi:sugar transferase (PEP-CTERM/EpsH1 system associated)
VNILWLNAGLLLPLDKGGKLRTWHLMRHLAQRHQITYLSFADPSAAAADLQGMRDVCHAIQTVPRTDPPKGSWRFRVDAARYLFDAAPYAVAKYRSSAYRHRLGALLASQQFDAIVCDFLVPLANMPERLPCPWILFTHNVEAEIWRRHAAMAASAVTRRLLTSQWRRMLRFERQAVSRADLVLAVSDADAETFGRLYPGAASRPIHVVQTGVDTTYFDPSWSEPRRAHLVFTGSMDWLPNEDGLTYFVRDVFPRIRAAEPGVTLSVIGRAPTPAVAALAVDPAIEVTGRVADVRPHVGRGTVYVVPLRIGGGTRLKIFEAMAMGKAVVSTTVGAEGLPVTPERDIVIADDPAAFAQAVVELIRNDERRRRLECAARALVVRHYDWSAVAHQFEDVLARVGGGIPGDEIVRTTRPAEAHG